MLDQNTAGQVMLRGLPGGSTLTRMYSFLAVPLQQRSGSGDTRARRRRDRVRTSKILWRLSGQRTAAAGRLAFVDAVRDNPAGPAAPPAAAYCRRCGYSLRGLSGG